MASGAFAIFLAFLAVPAGAWLVAREAKRAPPARPLEPLPPTLTSPGPIQTYLAAPGAPADRVEAAARAILHGWLARRGMTAADAERLKLDPALRCLLDGSGAEAWAREQARARWRGSAGLFAAWWWLASLTSSKDARRARYVDVLTVKLMETVDDE